MNIEITRRKVKYLRLQVTASGQVKAVAPLRMSQREIDQFLQQKQAWVERKLSEIKQAQQAKPTLAENELQLHGERYCMGAALCHERRTVPQMLVEDKRKWSKAYAKNYLADRIEVLAKTHQFCFARLSIRDQKTRWGSCSAKGNISLNWRLVQMPKSVCDYVILHELAHTRHLNHSPAYWQVVEQVCPDYQQAKQWLRMHARDLPD